MSITLIQLLEIRKKHNLTDGEFTSLMLSNDYNPLTDRDSMHIIVTCIAISVIWDVIHGTLMGYNPKSDTNKSKSK